MKTAVCFKQNETGFLALSNLLNTFTAKSTTTHECRHSDLYQQTMHMLHSAERLPKTSKTQRKALLAKNATALLREESTTAVSLQKRELHEKNKTALSCAALHTAFDYNENHCEDMRQTVSHCLR